MINKNQNLKILIRKKVILKASSICDTLYINYNFFFNCSCSNENNTQNLGSLAALEVTKADGILSSESQHNITDPILFVNTTR